MSLSLFLTQTKRGSHVPVPTRVCAPGVRGTLSLELRNLFRTLALSLPPSLVLSFANLPLSLSLCLLCPVLSNVLVYHIITIIQRTLIVHRCTRPAPLQFCVCKFSRRIKSAAEICRRVGPVTSQRPPKHLFPW